MGIFSSKAPRMASSALVQYVKDTIASDKVVVFSKSYCPYCNTAKKVLENVKQSFTLVELDEREDGADIQDILSTITGFRTVPQVFIKGNCVGGGSDVKALYEKGELQKLLA